MALISCLWRRGSRSRPARQSVRFPARHVPHANGADAGWERLLAWPGDLLAGEHENHFFRFAAFFALSIRLTAKGRFAAGPRRRIRHGPQKPVVLTWVSGNFPCAIALTRS